MTKQELRDYRHLRAEIRQLDDEIEYWRGRAERCTRAPDKTPVMAGQTDPLPDIMDMVIACEKAQADKIAKLINIEEVLSTLDERESRMMRLYYVNGLSWHGVAETMGYGIDRVHQLHGAVLKRLQFFTVSSVL